MFQTYQYSEKWYMGDPLENCNTVCKKHGIVCSEKEFQSHINEVDSSEDVLSLIDDLGGITSDKSCSRGYMPAHPLFNNERCFYGPETISKFKCNTVPIPKKKLNQRLCYCHKSKGTKLKF